MISGWAYEEGFASMERELSQIRRRIARGRERVDDRADLEKLELAQAELRALYRADRRIELELLADGLVDPLSVALIQAEELLVDRLSLRIIPPETREALRREREADWAVLLYGLADPGGDSATT
jgi:hypothetical protein